MSEWKRNIQILEDTLAVCARGYYIHQGLRRTLKLSRAEMEAVRVFLPEEIEKLGEEQASSLVFTLGDGIYSCQNADAFRVAMENSGNNVKPGEEVLVLNLANPVIPGGGARRGAKAQEEDLCRRSSLLLSLESVGARKYYEYNRQRYSNMSSHAVIVTPKVEIIKDESGRFLEDTTVVAVMTCAAPIVNEGLDGLNQEAYENLLYERINGMLRCAAYLGYKKLVLGAFGCGAFGNDARLVSDIFYKVLKEFRFRGMGEASAFRRISFAVLSRDPARYNYKEFYRNFGGNNFYREERAAGKQRYLEKIREKEKNLDKIRGSLIGGAIGDALGYPVEFLSVREIKQRCGSSGITGYLLDRKTGKALISDDTQMTLFTANGILVGETRMCMRGVGANPITYVSRSYQDWLNTQRVRYDVGKDLPRSITKGSISWLLDVPELYNPRAPGNTCMHSLWEQRTRKSFGFASNNSKGCGGLMRIAPLALHYTSGADKFLLKAGASLSSITHGHPLGYLPSSVLSYILSRIVYPDRENATLKELIQEALDQTCELFQDTEYLQDLREITEKAMALAENKDSDENNIRKLGEGWVAEEALAIALYCSLRHEKDFSSGIIAAVNHDGDSDSTGSITGNILGAIHGYDAIDSKWKENLELLDVLLEMADDLCHGCQMSEYGGYGDPDWARKYIYMHWKPEQRNPVFFCLPQEKNGCFSEDYEAPFEINGVWYYHVEQYLMAKKAELFRDRIRYERIVRERAPEKCRDLGQWVRQFNPETWDSAKYHILLTGLRAKFDQNPDIREKLLETGNAQLAKASPRDAVWGIGMAEEEAAKVHPRQWPGKNLLGKALMEIREELANRS